VTDYKATSELWEQVQAWSEDRDVSVSCDAACILELRSRVEVLEAANRARLIEIIRLTNAIARLVPDRDKFLTDTTADEDDAKPTPNDRQIRSSLLDLVAICLNECGGGSWDWQARAVIREVAAWMTSNPDVYFPPALVFALEKEAEQ
jgi:hypothetical protein